MTKDEAHAVWFVLHWAQGRSVPADEQATRAARVLLDGARKAGCTDLPGTVHLSAVAALHERLIQLRAGTGTLDEPLTGDECAAIEIIFNLLDRIERRTLKEQSSCH